nr:retrovirus-related Pol polyprotein from transposon TNT 1-94 [Tanacetum cinerariifolium]
MKNHESRPPRSAPLSEANVVTYNQSGGRGRGSDRGRGRGRGCSRGHGQWRGIGGEILAIHEAIQECIWLRSVIQHIHESCEISSRQEPPTVVHEDNAPCIPQLKDSYTKDERTKHILLKFFFHSLLAEEW